MKRRSVLKSTLLALVGGSLPTAAEQPRSAASRPTKIDTGTSWGDMDVIGDFVFLWHGVSAVGVGSLSIWTLAGGTQVASAASLSHVAAVRGEEAQSWSAGPSAGPAVRGSAAQPTRPTHRITRSRMCGPL